MNETRSLVIRGHKIFEDGYGHICLDDLWRAAKANASRTPTKWRLGRMAQALIEELEKKIQISSLKENKAVAPSIYSKRGPREHGHLCSPDLSCRVCRISQS